LKAKVIVSGTNQKTAENRVRSAEAVDAATVEKLALAVAKLGSDALLIDQDNRSSGRLPISDAAWSGACFSVELADDMIGLDADKSEAARWVRDFLIGELENRRIPFVVLNSGWPGHLHLFTRVTDPALKREIEIAARFAGCNVRAGQRIRPPLSPHRSGLPVSLVAPAKAAQALRALASTGQQPLRIDKRRGPSGRIFALLRHGDREGRYNSRSEVVQAIALAAVNAKLPEQWLLKVLLDPNNGGGEKVQELTRTKGEREAHRYVAMMYRNAVKRYVAQPPFHSRSDVIDRIDEIERGAAADAERWKERAGTTDLAVLHAHLQIMRRCGSIDHGAAFREVARLSGINSISTVSAAHSRLERSGYLRCVARAKHEASARYIVALPKSLSRTILPMGALGDCSAEGSSAGANVFRWRGGLGKAAWRVWHALDGRTAVELSALLGLKPHSVAKHLAKLRTHDLAARCPDGRWRRLDNLDAAAKRLGIAGEGEGQRERYEHEREVFRQQLHRRRVHVRLKMDEAAAAIGTTPSKPGETLTSRVDNDYSSATRHSECAAECGGEYDPEAAEAIATVERVFPGARLVKFTN
jgi:hypothetical protein